MKKIVSGRSKVLAIVAILVSLVTGAYLSAQGWQLWLIAIVVGGLVGISWIAAEMVLDELFGRRERRGETCPDRE